MDGTVEPQPAKVSPVGSTGARLPVLDQLRLVAIVYITAHHIVTATGHERWPPLVSLGDLGIGIFCMISGYLAFRPQEKALPPALWLGRRLRRLYPAFWIATVASLVLAALAHHKPFTILQAAIQMTGLGYFFYGVDRLVNQATWFVSLILLCYAVAFIAKCTRRPALALVVVVLESIALIIFVPITRPAEAFTIVFCAGALAAWAGLKLPAGRSSWPIAWASGLVYEFFLVHGIFIVAAIKLVPAHPVWAAATLGVAGAVVAAAGLKWMVGRLVNDE